MLETTESQEQQVTVDEQKPQEEPQAPVCKFFNSKRGCRHKTQCHFQHVRKDVSPQREESSTANGGSEVSDQVGESEGQKPAPKDGTSKPSSNRKKLCWIYSRGQRCRFGSECRFLHERRTGGADTGEDAARKTEGLRERPPQSARRTAGQNRSKRLCRYFKNGTCTMEDRCKFFHPKSLDNVEVSNDVNGTSKEEVGEAGVQQPLVPQNAERPSRVIHSAHKPVPRPGRPTVSMEGATEEELSKLQETEISLLKKRFSKEDIEEITEEDTNCKAYKIQVSPSDPDWPFDVQVFELHVNFPEKYPIQVADISLTLDQALPETVIRHLNQEIKDWLQEKQASNESTGRAELMFRPFLHWFDRNLEDMFTEAAKLFKKEVVANAAGLEFVSFQSLPSAHAKDKHAATTSQESQVDTRSQEKEPASGPQIGKVIRPKSKKDEPQKYQAPKERGEVSQGQGQESGKAVQNAPAVRSAPVKKGTEAKFMNMEMSEDVATVYAQQIVITVQCIRCKSRHDVKTRPQQLHVISCKKCQHQYKAAFRPAVIHQYSPVIGYFDLDGCVPFDLILVECDFLIGCLQCDKETNFKGVQPGQHRDLRCSHCHQRLRLKGSTVKFTQLQPSQPSGNSQVIRTQTKSKRVPKDPAIQEGLPLPSNGICKHYKKSFRWLRFPCCGRTFPCDVCHDDDQKGDHEMKLANRMICGFCAKEQPFAADKPCILCGSNMKKGGGTHWEGGKGCRDRIKMSRNDAQKYQGISKTVSRKEQEKREPKKKAKKADK
ncbi:Hypp1230 [Branchiostoma lanceolatum]|uniref:Nucleoporin NUP42 n=1 Tax=Branchiostoma lanceolatum TaxID=7740 RepID=A0A8J9ZHG0_BRALA|nr:Hypp1230 [Branchiostoma lanceolatum]